MTRAQIIQRLLAWEMMLGYIETTCPTYAATCAERLHTWTDMELLSLEADLYPDLLELVQPNERHRFAFFGKN